jgi:Xaa-Pro aminopeptidase
MTLIKAPEPQGYALFGPEPKFPDFPYAEWNARINKVRKLMKENKIDLLMLTSEKNCRYFTGFTTGHWIAPSIQPLVALIPSVGEPVLIAGELFRGTVESQSWIRDIRGQADPHEIKSHRELPKEIAATIKEMGFGKANIALEKGWLGHMWIPRPLNDIETLMRELPEAKFVDGDKVIWGCRMIKSSLEIDRLKKAATILTQGQAAIVEEYRPGMTETDVGKIMMHSLVENGMDWVQSSNIACGADKEGMLDTLATFDAQIHKGDYLWIDVVACHKGYWADMARIFNVGPVPEDFKKIYEVLWKAFDSAVEVVRPGIKAKEVWETVARIEKEAGFPPLEVVGHSIGLDIHEPPYLSPSSETILEPGMTFELEPALLKGLRRLGGGGVFHYEDLIIITERGCEVVRGLRRDIIEVTHPYT